MWIERLHIEGFGLHRDLHLEFGPGLNVVLGPNEAGKSTLHAFVRAVFHGLPRNGPKHFPLAGGRHGGALGLVRGEERVRIERVFTPRKALRVLGPHGEEGAEEMLERLLGKVDADLYRSVFGFDLEDLQKLPLGSDEIDRHLFDAGLLGAGKSLVALRKELHDAKEEVLRARSGPIRESYRTITALGKELAEKVARSKGHGERLRREAELEAAIAAAKERRRELESEKRRWDRLVDLWPYEVERRSLRERLEGLPPSRGSAAALQEALSLHDRLREREQAQREGLDALLREEAELREAIERLTFDESQLGREPRLAALEEERAFVEEARESVAKLHQAIAQRDATIASLLASLGDDWSVERALDVDRSLTRRESLEARALALREAEQALEEAKRRAEAAGQNLEERAREREAARVAWEEQGEIPTEDELDARARALAALRAGLAERERLAQREETGKARGAGSTVARIAASTLLALVAATLFFVEKPLPGAVFLLAALGLAWMWSRRVSAAGDELRAAREQKEEELRASAAALGLPPTFGAADVEGAALALDRDRSRRARWEDLARQLREREERTTLARGGWESARGQEEEARALWTACHEAWVKDCSDLGPCLDAASGAEGRALSPDAARERLSRVERIASLWETREEERAEKERLEGRLRDWVGRARELLASVDPGEDFASLRIALVGLRKDIDEAKARAEQRRNLLRRLETVEASLAKAREEVARVSAEAARCLEEQGVEDREELVERLSREQAREEIERDLRRIENSFLKQLGEGAEAEETRRLLSEGRRDDWVGEQARAREAIEERTEEIENLQQELTLAQGERAREEVSDAIPALAERIENEKAAWGEAIQQYRRAASLELLLDEALEELQESRQPLVMRSASAFFRLVTGERYVQIRQMREEQKVEVVRPHGEAVAAADLSRGTREQLYLCLRLGLADAFAEQGAKLPLLMDDVLVNFDPERSRAMAKVLQDAADRHQILLFTCHPSTAALLEGGAGAACISLSVTEDREEAGVRGAG